MTDAAPRPDDRLRPLAELPEAALAPLHGVLTDIDDTLTTDGTLGAAAAAALDALAAAGVPVIAVTGRPAGWSEPMARAWPVAAIVAENGAVMLRRDAAAAEGLRRDFVDTEATRTAHARRLAACAQDVLARVPGATLARDSAGRITDIAVDHSEFVHLDEHRIAEVVAVMREHGLTATVSSIHVNGWLGGHNKWTGATWAVQTALGRGFDAGEWVYVGDSTNDQLMFQHMPLSVGVANLARFVPKLRHLPGFITGGERGEGFAELAARLLQARAGRR